MTRVEWEKTKDERTETNCRNGKWLDIKSDESMSSVRRMSPRVYSRDLEYFYTKEVVNPQKCRVLQGVLRCTITKMFDFK